MESWNHLVVLENRKIGKLENWEIGKLENRKIGKLENWKIGKLENLQLENRKIWKIEKLKNRKKYITYIIYILSSLGKKTLSQLMASDHSVGQLLRTDRI